MERFSIFAPVVHVSSLEMLFTASCRSWSPTNFACRTGPHQSFEEFDLSNDLRASAKQLSSHLLGVQFFSNRDYLVRDSNEWATPMADWRIVADPNEGIAREEKRTCNWEAGASLSRPAPPFT